MNDTYANIDNCIKRLFKEYQKHKRLVIAVDFDDSLYPWTDKNSVHTDVVDVLKRCQKHNFYIVCFTASAPERYEFIEKHINSLGIKIDSINKNPIPLPFGNNGKIYYNILLDDRAGLSSALEILAETLNKIENEYTKQE